MPHSEEKSHMDGSGNKYSGNPTGMSCGKL